VNFRIGTVLDHQVENGRDNTFGADLAREGSEVYPSPNLAEENLKGACIGVMTTGSIGKGIGTHKPNIAVPGSILYNGIDTPVPHSVSKDPRGLAVTTVKGTTPAYLNVSLDSAEGGECVQDHTIFCRVKRILCRHTGGHPSRSTLNTSEESRKGSFPFPHNNIVSERCHFMVAGGGMRTSGNGDAGGVSDFISERGNVD